MVIYNLKGNISCLQWVVEASTFRGQAQGRVECSVKCKKNGFESFTREKLLTIKIRKNKEVLNYARFSGKFITAVCFMLVLGLTETVLTERCFLDGNKGYINSYRNFENCLI